jgi:hypothetical protein
MESIALGVPAVTTDLSASAPTPNATSRLRRPGVLVLNRRYAGFDQAADQLTDYLWHFIHLNRRQRIELRNKVERLSEMFDWSVWSNITRGPQAGAGAHRRARSRQVRDSRGLTCESHDDSALRFIPCDDNWPSEEDMRNRNAVIKQLTERGVGECVESGGGCGKMEFCFEVADVADASAAFQALLEAHFPAGHSVSTSMETKPMIEGGPHA